LAHNNKNKNKMNNTTKIVLGLGALATAWYIWKKRKANKPAEVKK